MKTVTSLVNALVAFGLNASCEKARVTFKFDGRKGGKAENPIVQKQYSAVIPRIIIDDKAWNTKELIMFDDLSSALRNKDFTALYEEITGAVYVPVIKAAKQRSVKSEEVYPSGLTERQIEILRKLHHNDKLTAADKDIARALVAKGILRSEKQPDRTVKFFKNF